MPRTTKQLQAYCKHAIRNGTPRDQVISELLSQELNQDAANQMYSDSLKEARKSALVIIIVGIVLATSCIGLVVWAASGGVIAIWPVFPITTGFIVFFVGLSKFIRSR